MGRTIKIILIVLIAVIIIAAIMFLIWALIYRPPIIFRTAEQPITEETEDAGGLEPATGTVITEVATGTPIITGARPFLVSAPKTIQEQQVKNLSVLFVERFGSFSNQGNYENFYDLMPLMTSSMRTWAEQYIATNPLDPSDPYYGISTKALATKIVSIDIDAGQAEVNIETQRRETKTGEEERTFIQAINLDLIKIDNEWLISSATWQ
jgi:hypothetical protein